MCLTGCGQSRQNGRIWVTGRETEFFESVKSLEVPRDYAEAAKWYRKAAEQGHAGAQYNLGFMYGTGRGVPQNDVEAYVWWSLSAAQGDKQAATSRDIVARRMSRQEVVLGQQRAAAFVARKESASSERDVPSLTSIPAARAAVPKGSGTGFFITQDGHLLTSFHVVKEASRVEVLTKAGILSAVVIRSDPANDVALLKVSAVSQALPICQAARLPWAARWRPWGSRTSACRDLSLSSHGERSRVCPARGTTRGISR